jgi:hypothetical protein
LVVVEGNLNAQRYVDAILEPHLLPFMEAHPELGILQHDNARPHTAKLTTEFLHAEGIEVMQWLPLFPRP